MIHKYLFFIKDGLVRSYKFDHESFHLKKYKGEDFCTIHDQTFWNWWEDSNSFIDSEDCVDFCFVGDEITNFYSAAYQTVEVSEWNANRIQTFLSECIKNCQIELTCINQGNSQTIHYSKVPQYYKYEKVVKAVFFTVPPILEQKPIETNYDDSNEQYHDKSLRNYYLKQLNQIK